ncbi:DNA repair protein [Micromonospora ureilytica]|uniref:DNA repair protein n=1 Tax=Micromonospora ureilytica TaxID=709868 RepID=A0A3N9XZT6_9ACTN|nr:DNA repair protein [Micromonospora ureilytica]RQX18450.1 DNA repair protein [Micromonospora ureilytica]
MPIQPSDNYQQNPERLWQAADAVGGNPPQPRYRNPRTIGGGALSWAGLNKLSVGSSSRHRLNNH